MGSKKTEPQNQAKSTHSIPRRGPFIIAAASLLLAAQTLIPPVSDDKRRVRLLAKARSELQEPARVSNAAASTQGLPNVDPVYTWVRLAQRVPIRIAIDNVPPGVPLVSGLTATVTIRDGRDGTLLQKVRAELERSFSGLIGGASARPGCIPGPSSPQPS
jgi:hypothetical protein